MKAIVRYHNKPHDLKISNIHIVPQAKGIWWVTAELNLRGYVIGASGSSPTKSGLYTHETYFEDDHENEKGQQQDWDIRAALILISNTKEESNISLVCHNIYKHTYHAVLINSTVFGKNWDKYCAKNFAAKELKRKAKNAN